MLNAKVNVIVTELRADNANNHPDQKEYNVLNKFFK
jgi:hypothetical protein